MPAHVRLALAALAAAVLSAGPAFADATTASVAELRLMIDWVWVLFAASLVFMMQIGFLLLEAGMVRSKNSINVALKNVLDFVFSALAFSAAGFMLAFGASSVLPVGWDAGLLMLRQADPQTLVFFVFQVMFCGTAATIVSGAVAERMKLKSYVAGSFVIGAVIYPVFVHWAWGAGLGPNDGAFLANMGFIDFAGSTVVHGTGGWISLAACLVLGARAGRFDAAGRPVRFAGHSPVLAACGALFLFVGWIGFNGGSTLAATPAIAHIIVNTVVAGAAGGVVGLLLGQSPAGLVLPEKPITGVIGGLVAITAGCNVLDPAGSLVIGAVGAAISLYGNDLLEQRFRIDDAVGAIGVHAFAGAAGAILLAVLAPAANLSMGRLELLGVQAIGVGVNFLWSFGTGLVLFWSLRQTIGLRVTADQEERGLNESEHGARLGVGHVEDALGKLASGASRPGLRLPVSAGDEAERLTRTFNALLDNMEREEQSRSIEKDAARATEEAERLSAFADATFEGLCISIDGVIADGNAALGRLLGLETGQLRGRRLADFIAPGHAGELEQLAASDDSAAREICIIDSRGALVPVEVRGRDIEFRGEARRVLAIVDLRERKAAEARIHHLAQHDPLTGLPNRTLFNERLTSMIERTVRDGVMSAVILIDLDRFKDVNDLYGHGAGDEVLKATAERLKTSLRRRDTAARLGGDEFAVLQVDIDFVNQAADLAHRLVEELNKPIQLLNGTKVRVGASVGVAICPKDGLESVRLVTRADTALYHAKDRGKNCYAIYEDGMDEHVRRRQVIELLLDAALEEDQFELYFQPRMAVANAAFASYEALIRWRHPERGLVSPGEFIPVAEGSGRIVKIGEWVLRSACFTAAARPEMPRVSVNVSPLQFRDRGFAESVRRALKDSDLSPSRLEIEITENVLINDDQLASSVFRELKQMGVCIALDDFGTGYSSLGYLSRFAFDSLKIDQSFVRGLSDGESAGAIVETIIRLGRALEISVVAEGVETPGELAFLVAAGCDEVQGFLVGRPQPCERLDLAPNEAVRTLTLAESGVQKLIGVAGGQGPAPQSSAA